MTKSVGRAFATVGGWTMGSRILGFVRDVLMSRILGAGPVADAFNTAFLLPNLFRRFLAEGAMNTAFLPKYKDKLDDPEGASHFTNNVFSTFLLLLLALITLIQIFMPATIVFLASGFLGDARFDMAQGFSRITIFYILFMSLSALCGTVLNAHQRFTAAAAAPILMNIVFIPTLLLINYLGIEGEDIGYWLSWAVFVAGLSQFALVYSALKKSGFHLKFMWPKWDRDLKHFFIIFLPALAASGVGQINLVVGRQIASWTEGAVSWLYYADRLIQLPMGVIGIPVGIVLLSVISGKDADRTVEETRGHYNHALLFSVFFALPAAVAIFAIPQPLVQVLFEGGDFNANDTTATANALMIYAWSIPALVLYRADIQLFFARKDTRTPLYYAIASMLVNITLAIGLYKQFGYLSAVIATTVSAWVSYLFAHFGSRKFGEAVRVTRQTRSQILRVCIVAVLMGAICYGLAIWANNWLATPFIQWIALAGIVIFAMVFYFGLALPAIGMKPRDLRKVMRR